MSCDSSEFKLFLHSVQENDSYEYAEPADIWGSLNKEFWEGLASKKWTERRDSLKKFKVHQRSPKPLVANANFLENISL